VQSTPSRSLHTPLSLSLRPARTQRHSSIYHSDLESLGTNVAARAPGLFRFMSLATSPISPPRRHLIPIRAVSIALQ
jgi:hypothetical protein